MARYFEGTNMASIRWRYESSSLSSADMNQMNLQQNKALQQDYSTLLTLELQRDEEILQAYCSSAKIGVQGSDIQRFFFERLQEHSSRLKKFYGGGLRHQGCELDFNQLMGLNISVNEHHLGTLEGLCRRAMEHLDPRLFQVS